MATAAKRAKAARGMTMVTKRAKLARGMVMATKRAMAMAVKVCVCVSWPPVTGGFL
jgi:hypothetical protein